MRQVTACSVDHVFIIECRRDAGVTERMRSPLRNDDHTRTAGFDVRKTAWISQRISATLRKQICALRDLRGCIFEGRRDAGVTERMNPFLYHSGRWEKARAWSSDSNGESITISRWNSGIHMPEELEIRQSSGR